MGGLEARKIEVRIVDHLTGEMKAQVILKRLLARNGPTCALEGHLRTPRLRL